MATQHMSTCASASRSSRHPRVSGLFLCLIFNRLALIDILAWGSIGALLLEVTAITCSDSGHVFNTKSPGQQAW